MNDKEQQIIENSHVDKNVKRRNFIKKATAGVVITTLPAKSVWGACNASGVSGGSKTITGCDMPFLSNGRSPGSWEKFVEYDVTSRVHRNKLREMFTVYSRASDYTLNSKCKDLKKYIKALNPVLVDNGPTKVYLNVFDALEGKGDLANLASCYLNTIFRFYTLPIQFVDADELVEHIYGVVKYGGGSQFGAGRMAASSQDFGGVLGPSFNDGSSTVTIPS